MHYNQFTIDYIEAIKRCLNIELSEIGEAIYFPDLISDKNILDLKYEIQSIWPKASNAIEVVHKKHDATIQSGLFGLVNELDTALKVGFLISDRVVLIDYLFERLLANKEPSKIDRLHLGVIANSLVNALPLAQIGRVVIIPSPFKWHGKSKEIIKEVAEKVDLTVDLIGLLNMLSITKYCQLHPYTVAESEKNYYSIVNHQIDHVNAIGKDASNYAYDGILAALLSERLLNETELKVALDIPIGKYFDIINSNKSFYSKYLNQVISGGSLNVQNNIDNIRNAFLKVIEERNKISFRGVSKVATNVAGIGGGAIALLGSVSVISAPLTITGAILGLSAALTGLVNSKDKSDDIIISVFKNLYDANVPR